jgi:hypothetical protein
VSHLGQLFKNYSAALSPDQSANSIAIETIIELIAEMHGEFE